jgi:hypothetical protein
MIETLPHPLAEELTMTTKHKYFFRLLGDDKLASKVKSEEITKWIHINFESVFLHNKPITYKEFKKLIR